MNGPQGSPPALRTTHFLRFSRSGQIIRAPFPDKMPVLLFRPVSDRFLKGMRSGMSVGEQIVRVADVSCSGKMVLPFRNGAHAVVALMLIGVSLRILPAFGKQNVK